MGLRAVAVAGCCWALLACPLAVERAGARGWTAPASLPREAYASELDVDLGDRGGVLAFPRGIYPRPLIVARITTRGTLGPLRRVPGSHEVAEELAAAVDRRGDAALAWAFPDVKPGEEDLRFPCCDRAAAATWRRGHPPSRAVPLSTPDDHIRDLTVGMGRAGTGIVLWQLLDSGAVGGAVGRRGAGFAPFELDPGQGGFGDVGVSLGLDARGRALAVWGRRSGLRTATSDASGVFGRQRALHLPRDALDSFETTVRTDRHGNQVAVWQGRSGSARDTIQTAFRRPGADFGRPRVLTRDGRAGAPAVAMGAAGHVVVAWASRRSRRTVTRVARRRPGGRFGPPQTLSRAGSETSEPAVGADSRGRAIVLVSIGDERTAEVRAFRAGPTRPFGHGEDVSRAGRGSYCDDPHLDVSARGAAFAWWECTLANGDMVGRHAAFRP